MTINNFTTDRYKRISILIAEDDPDIRKILIHILQSNGFEVVEAIDGNDAIRKLREKKVDIIISDIMMPGISGIELCEKVKNDMVHKSAYFILLSARDELSDNLTGIQSGVDEYISKPFEPLELVARVKAGEHIIKLRNELENRTKHQETHLFTDTITKVYNRKFFDEFLSKEYENAKRYNYPLSVILITIDNFNFISSVYGYSAGNALLSRIASILKETIRKSDIVARYGYDEFIVLLTNTPPNGATEVSRRIKNIIEGEKILTGKEGIPVTVSIGTGPVEKDLCNLSTPNKIIIQSHMALQGPRKQGKYSVQ